MWIFGQSFHSIICPNDVDSRLDLSLCREASNCSSLHLSGCFSSPSRWHSVFDQASDFLSKIKYGKIATIVRTMWILVRTCSSEGKFLNSNPTVRMPVYHGSDARTIDMEIACSRSTVRMTILLVQKREAFIRKFLAADMWPFGRGSQTGKIFSEIFGISVAQLSVWMAPNFIKLDAHLNPQPINRGP